MSKIHELNLKVQDLGGKFKKPALRKVRVSADEMMRALLGSKHKGSMDLRANLKSVKKEDIKQEKVLIKYNKHFLYRFGEIHPDFFPGNKCIMHFCLTGYVVRGG